MSVYYLNNYWLLGDGADEEAKRWVANDDRQKIMYSSPRAVEIEETGKYLSPELPIPPKGFVVVVISDNEVTEAGLTLGVAHWGGDGGWINLLKGLSDEQRQQQQVDRNLFAVAVDAFIDCAWRGDGHYSGHWEATTDEQRQRIRGHVEADVESWLRQGDIHRGQTPLEYLAAKDREQEERR